MKNEQSVDTDGTLMNTLRSMGTRLDPVPDGLTAAAVAALSLRTVDKTAAALTYDSLLDDDAEARRTPGSRRHLSFAAHGVCLEVDVGEDRILGRLVPPSAADVELRWPGGSTTVVADERGAFSVRAVPAGPVSIRCQRGPSDAASPLVTDWVTL